MPAGAAAAERAHDRGERLGTTIGGIVSDHHRYAITQPNRGTLRVLDRRRGTRRDIASTCALSDMAYRSPALVLCGADSLLLDPTADRPRAIPGAAPGLQYGEIGARWASAIGGCPDGQPRCKYLVDWRTGRSVVIPDPAENSRVYDLDQPTPQPLPDGYSSATYQRRGDTILRRKTPTSTVLVLERDGAARRIGTCRQLGCRGLQLTSRYATWSADDTAYAYDLRTRRRRSWTSPARTDVRYAGVPVAQAARSLVVGFELRPNLEEDRGDRVVRAFGLPR